MSDFIDKFNQLQSKRCLKCNGSGEIPCPCGSVHCLKHPCPECNDGFMLDHFRLWWIREGKQWVHEVNDDSLERCMEFAFNKGLEEAKSGKI